MWGKILHLRQAKIVRNATSGSKGRQGNDAYRVREHLSEAEMDKLLAPSRATSTVTGLIGWSSIAMVCGSQRLAICAGMTSTCGSAPSSSAGSRAALIAFITWSGMR